MRRLQEASLTWYPVNDNLYGTSFYGDSSNNLASWGIPFDKIVFNEFLFATNNLQFYIFIEKSVIVPYVRLGGTNGGTMEVNIRSSQTPDAPGTSYIFNRNDIDTEPDISLTL